LAKAIFNDEEIKIPDQTIKRLKRGLQSPNELLLILRSLRDIFDNSTIPRRRLKHINVSIQMLSLGMVQFTSKSSSTCNK
jgi:hypothetical protein